LAWSIDILLQVLSAVEEIHAGGITHRDIKPENVFLTRTRRGRDKVRIIDFGIAKMLAVSNRSSPREIVGTPHYMSPELIRGERADSSADLYAVGVLLYRLVTGQLLFDGDSASEVMRLQLAAPRPDARTLAPEVPRALAELCNHAVALERGARFQTAAEMASALSSLRAELGLDEAPSGRSGRGGRGSHISGHPPRPPFSRYTFIDKRTSFSALQKLDHRISDALARGDRDEACRGLEDGVSRAELARNQGDLHLAALAWASFGGRLAEEWARAGHREKAAELVREALAHVGNDEFAEARFRELLARLTDS
jgi:serine/threonine protein kinase